ncbi:MAG: hypothetical protein N3A02_07770 [Rectinema sp.]|nr:hypothetical protein [Rectinema sp.]
MRKSVLIIALLAIAILSGCELFASLFPGVTYDDLVGEWDFPSVMFNNAQTGAVHLSVLPKGEDDTIGIDLSWNEFANFYYGDGTMDGNKFEGTYDEGNDDTINEYSITVTFSLKNDKLKAVFSGQGPLNGLVLENGVPSEL